MIPRRIQIVVFVVLLVVLAWVVSSRLGRGPELGAVLFANEKFEPLAIQDPTLRLDLLERVRKLEYKGTHRNIFSASLPPKPQLAPVVQTPAPGPQVPRARAHARLRPRPGAAPARAAPTPTIPAGRAPGTPTAPATGRAPCRRAPPAR